MAQVKYTQAVDGFQIGQVADVPDEKVNQLVSEGKAERYDAQTDVGGNNQEDSRNKSEPHSSR
jgi:hypothetical protein